MQDFLEKQFMVSYKREYLSIITYDPLVVCGHLCIYRDFLLSYFAVFGMFLGVRLWAVGV